MKKIICTIFALDWCQQANRLKQDSNLFTNHVILACTRNQKRYRNNYKKIYRKQTQPEETYYCLKAKTAEEIRPQTRNIPKEWHKTNQKHFLLPPNEDQTPSHVNRCASSAKPVDIAGGAAGSDSMAEAAWVWWKMTHVGVPSFSWFFYIFLVYFRPFWIVVLVVFCWTFFGEHVLGHVLPVCFLFICGLWRYHKFINLHTMLLPKKERPVFCWSSLSLGRECGASVPKGVIVGEVIRKENLQRDFAANQQADVVLGFARKPRRTTTVGWRMGPRLLAAQARPPAFIFVGLGKPGFAYFFKLLLLLLVLFFFKWPPALVKGRFRKIFV